MSKLLCAVEYNSPVVLADVFCKRFLETVKPLGRTGFNVICEGASSSSILTTTPTILILTGSDAPDKHIHHSSSPIFLQSTAVPVGTFFSPKYPSRAPPDPHRDAALLNGCCTKVLERSKLCDSQSKVDVEVITVFRD